MRSVLVVVAIVATVVTARGDAPSAVVVVVDGLGADAALRDRLPLLAARAAGPSATWATARAVLPARTNPNHASMLTGYWPDGHGIVGNRFWDAAGRRRAPADDPRLLDAETLFDVLAEQRPTVGVAACFGKAKLRRLFGGLAGRSGGAPATCELGRGETSDEETLRAATAVVQRDPALLVVTIADVDRTRHAAGPNAPAAVAAVARADRLLDRFLTTLEASERWRRTVVIVTADHGFAAIEPNGYVELPSGPEDGIVWVDEGRVAFGHRTGRTARAVAPAALLERRGVIAARSDLAALGLGHPRSGDFLLVAASGHAFTLDVGDHRLAGDHGAESERSVPFIVLGGHPALRRLPAGLVPDLPDLAPTVAAMLDLPAPRTRRPGAPRRGRRLPIWEP